jgi:DNA-binding NarL/FixJ family response regulator
MDFHDEFIVGPYAVDNTYPKLGTRRYVVGMSRKNREGVILLRVVNTYKLQRFKADVCERLSGAHDFKELGEQLIEYSLAHVGISGLNLFPFAAGGIDLHPVTFCERDTAENVARKALEMLPHAEEETLAIESCCRSPGKIVCLDEYLGAGRLARTKTFNEYWRPLGIERQLLCAMRDATGTPCAFLCFARSLKESRFSEEALASVQILCCEAERTLQRLQCEGSLPCLPVDQGVVMAALNSALPLACGVLDAEGRVLWLSDQAVRSLGLRIIRFGSRSYVSEQSPRLDVWRECAAAFASEGTLDQRWRISGLSARRMDQAERHPVVFVWEDNRGEQDATCDARSWSEVLPRFGLTHRESQVACLLGRGYRVVNVAHLLGLSEQTVRVHVKRVYRKLEVSGQVELIVSMRRLFSSVN